MCKTLKAPLDALWTQLSALAAKLKSGNPDPSEIATASGTIESVRQNAGKLGVPIKDQ